MTNKALVSSSFREAQSKAARPSGVRNKFGTYLGQRHVGELLEREAVLLPAVSLPLPLQDAARGHCGHAHAVTHEQDDVLGVTIGGTSGGEDVLDVSLGLGVPVVTVWGGKQERYACKTLSVKMLIRNAA